MKRSIITIIAAIFLLGIFNSCNSNSKTSESEDVIKIGFTFHTTSSFFDAVQEGIEIVVEENGATLISIDGKSDANYQLGVIEDFITQDVDAVIYTPVDAAASKAALEKLKEAGIPVINVDSAVNDLNLITSFVSTDNYSAGRLAGEELLKNHPNGGTVAILDYPENDAAVQRANGFTDAIKPHGFEVVAQLDAGVKPETGMSVAEDILQAHSDLTAMFVICDDSAHGTYAAIKASGMDVELYSVNGGPESKVAFKRDGTEGIWKASPAQSPVTMGKLAAEAAFKYINGENVEKEYLIPSFVISAENIDEYGDADWQ